VARSRREIMRQTPCRSFKLTPQPKYDKTNFLKLSLLEPFSSRVLRCTRSTFVPTPFTPTMGGLAFLKGMIGGRRQALH
jgi:hypothetical protein